MNLSTKNGVIAKAANKKEAANKKARREAGLLFERLRL
jgi:hypothetical protein